MFGPLQGLPLIWFLADWQGKWPITSAGPCTHSLPDYLIIPFIAKPVCLVNLIALLLFWICDFRIWILDLLPFCCLFFFTVFRSSPFAYLCFGVLIGSVMGKQSRETVKRDTGVQFLKIDDKSRTEGEFVCLSLYSGRIMLSWMAKAPKIPMPQCRQL